MQKEEYKKAQTSQRENEKEVKSEKKESMKRKNYPKNSFIVTKPKTLRQIE